MILYDEITAYKTADGKIFEDEDEAREYAVTKEAETLGDDLKCYDYKMELIPFNRLVTNSSGIYYMNIKTDKAYEWISSFLEDYCGYVVDGLTTAGMYYYDDTYNEWININKEMKMLQGFKDKMERGQ